MIPRMKDRVRVYHSGVKGTSPEARNRAVQYELRALLSSLENNDALAADARGRWNGKATHRARVEHDASLRVNAYMKNTLTGETYQILSVKPSSYHNAQGDPDHTICELMILSPAPELV